MDLSMDTMNDDTDLEQEIPGMTTAQARNLYTSHFLSTWNVRTYEFAAIIFTAKAYPETLLAASVRGIIRTGASICLSSSVGRWVDKSPSRLKTLQTTISVNRATVIAVSVLWFFIVESVQSSSSLSPRWYPLQIAAPPALLKGSLFALILLLGILENQSASGNMLSMERDWVVVAADRDGMPYDLTNLNSSMRRIDLICKLLAPILISVIVSATSTRIGVLVVGGMSLLSWGIEIWCARRVWNYNPKLREPKVVGEVLGTAVESSAFSVGIWGRMRMGLKKYGRDFENYFSSNVWIPSISLAFLHLSALSYGATFITYLLSVGISLDLITVARAIGSIVEISSTVVTPVGVSYLGKAVNHGGRISDDVDESVETAFLEVEPGEEKKTETGLERLGLWGLTWQLINLIPVVLTLWALSPVALPTLITRILPVPFTTQPLLTLTLFTFLSLSRLGLWIFDLTTQQLMQTMTPPSQRSAFAGVEYSFIALFELAQHVITLVLHRPEQFRWIATGSWAAVAVSSLLYAGWVRAMRGHLVHWERFGSWDACLKGREGWWR